MGSSSFAWKLQTAETAHSEGTETEGNSVRRDFFLPKSYFQQTASKTCFLELMYYVYLLGKHHNMSQIANCRKHLVWLETYGLVTLYICPVSTVVATVIYINCQVRTLSDRISVTLGSDVPGRAGIVIGSHSGVGTWSRHDVAGRLGQHHH